MKCTIFYVISECFLIALLILMSACSSGTNGNNNQLVRDQRQRMEFLREKGTSESQWVTREEGEIAPGYILGITNTADATLNGSFQVDSEGTLKLPYDVEIKAEGLRISELNKRLEGRYTKFIKNPQFRLEIEKRDVFVDVRGLVKKPGNYLVDADSSLDELVAQAGGLQTNDTNNVQAKYARISQLGIIKVINLKDYFSGTSGLIPTWQGGERVFFQNEGPRRFSEDREYIQVLGEIITPGAYPYWEGNDLLGYLTEAGGPTDRANLNTITLLTRRNGVVVQTDYALEEAGNVKNIQPGDTLIFQSDNRSDLERKGGVVASFAAIVSSIGLILLAL